ncbi:MAG: helix-turn-helix domain-containing protein [Actinobacteria bacterium]|nr:helix-turn-helix domain-containing protein [Actinomycetota bacterium]
MDGAGDVLDWLYGHEGEARVAFTSGASRVDAVLPAEVMLSVRDVLRVAVAGLPVIVLAAGRDLSPEQAGSLLGMSRTSVMTEIVRGTLPAHRVGSHWRLRFVDVLDRRERDAQAASEQAALARIALAKDLRPGG